MIEIIKDNLEIDKYIRKTLIEESELKPDRVLNAISVRGQNLSKLVENSIYMSHNLSDCLIIFEVLSNQNSNNNVVMEEDDDTITNYSAHYVKVLVYGNKSPYLINRLKARLLSRRVIDELHNCGIHIEKVSNPEPMTEWLNETLWVRNDLTIEISCRQSFEKSKLDYELNKLSSLGIKEIEE